MIFRVLLLPFAVLYGFVIAVRNFLYDHGYFRAENVGVPVISIGNISVGGTGKTPLVEILLGHLLQKDLRPAVVSRGYKRKSKGTVVVSDGKRVVANAINGGDEPLQLARKFSSAIVVVDEVRTRGARVAIDSYGAQIVILDDGFQHRAMRRDLDIVLLDAAEKKSRRWYLPAGRGRESLRNLARANVIVHTRLKGDVGARFSAEVTQRTNAPQFRMSSKVESIVKVADGKRGSITEIQGKNCLAFCGIAKPKNFRSIIEELGVKIQRFLPFPDHHYYTEDDLKRIQKIFAEFKHDFILTTEKDAARLDNEKLKDLEFFSSLYYVELNASIAGEERFFEIIGQAISKK